MVMLRFKVKLYTYIWKSIVKKKFSNISVNTIQFVSHFQNFNSEKKYKSRIMESNTIPF